MEQLQREMDENPDTEMFLSEEQMAEARWLGIKFDEEEENMESKMQWEEVPQINETNLNGNIR